MSRVRMLDVNQIAERLGVTARAVRALIKRKRLRAFQPGGKSCAWRVEEDDLSRYIETRYNRDK